MPIGTSTFGLVGMKFSFALIPGLSNHVSQREVVVASTPRVVPGLSCSEQLPREVEGGGRHQKKASIRFIAFPTKPDQAGPHSAFPVCFLLPGYQDKGLSERWGFASSARPGWRGKG